MATTCGVCFFTSHNPNDEQHGYCGRCHDYTKRVDSHLTAILDKVKALAPKERAWVVHTLFRSYCTVCGSSTDCEHGPLGFP